MAFIIKYSGTQYQAKITELEGYYALLETHLARMEELKNQMFDFWDDDKAQLTGRVLATEIRHVKSMMDMTKETMIFYKSAVEKLEGSDVSAKGLLEEALGILNAVG